MSKKQNIFRTIQKYNNNQENNILKAVSYFHLAINYRSHFSFLVMPMERYMRDRKKLGGYDREYVMRKYLLEYREMQKPFNARPKYGTITRLKDGKYISDTAINYDDSDLPF